MVVDLIEKGVWQRMVLIDQIAIFTVRAALDLLDYPFNPPTGNSPMNIIDQSLLH